MRKMNKKELKEKHARAKVEIDAYAREIERMNNIINKMQNVTFIEPGWIRRLYEPMKTSLKHKRAYMLMKWFIESEYINMSNSYATIILHYPVTPILKIYISNNTKSEIPDELIFIEVDKNNNIITNEHWKTWDEKTMTCMENLVKLGKVSDIKIN